MKSLFLLRLYVETERGCSSIRVVTIFFFKQSVFLIFPSMPQNEAFLIDALRTVTFLIIREPSQNERRSQTRCQGPLGMPPALCRGALKPPPLCHSQRRLQGTLPSLGRALSENKLQALIHSYYSCCGGPLLTSPSLTPASGMVVLLQVNSCWAHLTASHAANPSSSTASLLQRHATLLKPYWQKMMHFKAGHLVQVSLVELLTAFWAGVGIYLPVRDRHLPTN